MRNNVQNNEIPGFRQVPRTGVIYVMTEANRHGYSSNSLEWANLGQGAPETGEIPGGLPRITSIAVRSEDYEYSRVDGDLELREAVANLYNARYRCGRKSRYSAENVAISSGGRAGLTRVVSALGRTNVGHFLPDYTAYEELLDAFSSFVSIPILLDKESNYLLSADKLEKEILGRGLSALLLSNPGNPTGQIVAGSLLEDWVRVSRQHECSLIFDEFYSHYLYDCGRLSISAAEYVEDVDRDPIIIVDGLTKNWRYPGFRLSWTIGPKKVIETLASAGSFLDGGPPQPIQRAAIELVSKDRADLEARSIQQHFGKKRELMLEALPKLGITVDPAPQGAFYCWSDISKLPTPLNDGMAFFEAALNVGVIVVPGEFFDINPGHRRPERRSRFHNFIRLSFGPEEGVLTGALERLERIFTKRG